MKIKVFFDNLNSFFKDSNEDFVDIKGSIYKNEKGDISEIRFFNFKYDEFIVLDREGKISCINVEESEEKKEK